MDENIFRRLFEVYVKGHFSDFSIKYLIFSNLIFSNILEKDIEIALTCHRSVCKASVLCYYRDETSGGWYFPTFYSFGVA